MQPYQFRYEQKQAYTGTHLFWYCQSLARQCKRRFPGKPLLPSGARILYYTRRLLLAHGVLPEVNPDAVLLPEHVVQRFLQDASLVAERLVTDYPCAVGVRAAREAMLQHLLSGNPLPSTLSLIGTSAHRIGSHGEAQQLWGTCAGAASQEHLARLLARARPDRLLVAPVARPDDPPQVALHLLRDQLAQDVERGWQVPSAGAYLYDEPLEAWLLRAW